MKHAIEICIIVFGSIIFINNNVLGGAYPTCVVSPFNPITIPVATSTPPVLVNPQIIELSDAYPTTFIADYNRVGCEGFIHQIRIPDDQDAKITMVNGSRALKYPIHITGGRNVHVQGLEVRPEIQPGCDIGEAHQVRAPEHPNIHPRIPGGLIFRLEQAGASYVEGVDIDMVGAEADCFVIRNRPPLDGGSSNHADVLAKRHIAFVNTRCVGIEGLDDTHSRTPIGDGIHGDFFQNQGTDDIGSFIAENVTVRSSSNGITLHQWNASSRKPAIFSLKNYDHAVDQRYYPDDYLDTATQGLAFTGHGTSSAFENVCIDDPRGLNYGILNSIRLGEGGAAVSTPGIRSGPCSENAPAGSTGLEYVSPFP